MKKRQRSFSANFMQHYKKIFSAVLLLLLSFSTIAAKKKDSNTLWLQVADGTSKEWKVNIGAEFPGARATITREKAPDYTNTVAVKVDLSDGGRYAGLEYPLNIQDASMIQLMLWSNNVKMICVRILDSDGQFHVTSLFPKTRRWEKFELTLDDKAFPGHWGGKNDGKFRFPLKSVIIVAEDLPKKKGTFQVGGVRFAVNKKEISPELTWDLNVNIKTPGNMFFHNEGVKAKILLTNKTDSPIRKGMLKWKLIDHRGKTAAKGKTRLKIPSYGQKAVKLKLDNIDYGYYNLSTKVQFDNKGEKSAEAFLGVVKRLPNYGPKKDPESFFGLQLGDIFDPAAAARIGVKWDRPTRVWLARDASFTGQPSGYDRPSLAIPDRTPEEKKYFWPDDTAVSEGQKYGISSMMTLHYEPNGCKPMSPGDTGFPPSENQLRQWKEFVTTAVKRYDKLVSAWEIMNEAENTTYIMKNVSLPVGIKSYSELIRSAQAAIRKAGSKHPIVAIDIASGTSKSFINGVTENVGGLVDVYTGHPYAYPRYFGPGRSPILPHQNNMRERILDGLWKMVRYGQGGKQLWIGEIGWAVDVTVPTDCEHTRGLANSVAQGLIIIHSVPGIQRCFWFIQDGCNEGGFEYGLWRGNPFQGKPLQPLPGAVAYASCARFLYKVEPARQLVLPGMHGFAFLGRKKDRAVVALWAEDKDDYDKFSIELPSEDSTVHEMYGRRISAKNIKLNSEPIFLTVPYDSAEEFFKTLEKIRLKPRIPVRIEAAYFDTQDKLMIRMKNLMTEDQKIEVSAMGKQLERMVPARKAVTMELELPSIPEKAPKVEVRLAGETVAKITPIMKFTSCPYRNPKFNGDLASWGKAQAVLKSRLDILPPDLNIGWGGPADLSAEAWWGWNEEGFCFAARIRDNINKVNERLVPGLFWMGDSLQLAFDIKNNAAPDEIGFSSDDREFGFSGGKAFSCFPATKDIELKNCQKRVGDYTIYEVLIPWEKLGIEKPETGKIIAFNFIANDNDGNGRRCWIGLRPGIGEFKRPGAYLKVRLDKK